MPFLQEAFDSLFPDATPKDTWYVCLVEENQYYGGPEEGGWWGTDTELVAWKEFPNEQLAREAAKQVEAKAKEMDREARMNHGRVCQDQCDWLEDRGYDADSNVLPMPDLASFRVLVCQELPSPSRGPRHYE